MIDTCTLKFQFKKPVAGYNFFLFEYVLYLQTLIQVCCNTFII